jgi:formylglycine-generating enzyme required for sulfatase activity
VLVKAGVFRQGSPPREAGRGGDEAEREVTLSSDFYIGKTEVTVAQWGRFVAETGYRSEAEKGASGGFGWDGNALVQAKHFTWRNPGYYSGDRHPVTIVTYDDALAFTAWLARRAGRGVSLPTEAQWEYAARAGSPSRYPLGDRDAVVPEIGWFKENAREGAREVGQKRANAFGLHDTAGNVYEWCLDWYGPYPAGPVRDPLETRSNLSDKPRRVLRGGSFLKDAAALRSAARYRNTPGSRNADNGFRVVASAAASGAAARPAPAARAAGGSAAESEDGSAWAGLAVLGAMGLACVAMTGLVVAFLLRRRRGGVKTRIAPDGFTLFVPGAQAGQRLRYRYRAGGQTKIGETTITGDPAEGVFVYTGERPSAVDLLAAGAAAAPPPPPRRGEPRGVVSPTHRRPDEDEPFRGYPSAY